MMYSMRASSRTSSGERPPIRCFEPVLDPALDGVRTGGGRALNECHGAVLMPTTLPHAPLLPTPLGLSMLARHGDKRPFALCDGIDERFPNWLLSCDVREIIGVSKRARALADAAPLAGKDGASSSSARFGLMDVALEFTVGVLSCASEDLPCCHAAHSMQSNTSKPRAMRMAGPTYDGQPDGTDGEVGRGASGNGGTTGGNGGVNGGSGGALGWGGDGAACGGIGGADEGGEGGRMIGAGGEGGSGGDEGGTRGEGSTGIGSSGGGARGSGDGSGGGGDGGGGDGSGGQGAGGGGGGSIGSGESGGGH
mmetsp:Transcript_12957/g.33205  ORF Transcript_12957/g.33205 Transcript_12957/m.33205 type:complete len:309 (+) Transcript_12957:527-1453(+)